MRETTRKKIARIEIGLNNFLAKVSDYPKELGFDV